MKEEDRAGADMVLKDGNLITNVFNRLIRTCFYAVQNNCDGKIPKGDASMFFKEIHSRFQILQFMTVHVCNIKRNRLKYITPIPQFFTQI